MFNTNIEWHKPTEELPVLNDNDTLVLVYNGLAIQSVYYSSKHKLFNALDFDTEDEAKRTAVYPLLWAYMPELPKRESEDE